MILQYRNHPSIIIWGVRINESADDEEFYTRTNSLAHELDPSRQTGGVKASAKMQLLEDVYTYNDFSFDGKKPGCMKKKAVTPDMEKGYLVTEYNGHMYPTKTFDDEEHRCEHAMRHVKVLDAIAGEEDAAGGFGWVCLITIPTRILVLVTGSATTESWICIEIPRWQPAYMPPRAKKMLCLSFLRLWILESIHSAFVETSGFSQMLIQ